MPKANVGDIELFYQVQGDGFPLLMIQGYSGGHNAWFFQTRAFKKHYQVIVFDNRGIGKTQRSPAPYTVKTLADDAVGLLNHLGIDKAHILGMSLGGMVAQELAINYPEKVEKLVLVCTTTGDDEITNVHPDMLKALGLEEGDAQPDLRSLDFRQTTTAIVSLAFNKRLYRLINVPLVKLYMKLINMEGLKQQLEAVTGHSTGDRIHGIKAPTLVLTGNEDRLISPISSENIAGKIPDARLIKLEGGSHAFFMEMRKEFNREVLDFLNN
jgi:pimeloyl-ACP methyl ester carboxylesterase